MVAHGGESLTRKANARCHVVHAPVRQHAKRHPNNNETKDLKGTE